MGSFTLLFLPFVFLFFVFAKCKKAQIADDKRRRASARPKRKRYLGAANKTNAMQQKEGAVELLAGRRNRDGFFSSLCQPSSVFLSTFKTPIRLALAAFLSIRRVTISARSDLPQRHQPGERVRQDRRHQCPSPALRRPAPPRAAEPSDARDARVSRWGDKAKATKLVSVCGDRGEAVVTTSRKLKHRSDVPDLQQAHCNRPEEDSGCQ